MWPYFIPIIVIFFLQFHFSGIPKSKAKPYFALLLLLIFAGIRGNGSGDYFNYLLRGQAIKTVSDIFNNTIHMNLGYSILAYIVNRYHLPAQTVIIMMNVISISCVAVTIRRYSCMPVLSVLVFLPFYYQFDMHAARTAVAMGILMLSIPYIIDRKPLKFAVVLAVSMVFHPEALIGIFLYFLPWLKLDFKIMTTILAIEAALVVWIGMDRFVLTILRFTRLGFIYNKFARYVNNARYGYATSLLDPRILLVILLFVVASYLITKPNDLERLMINITFTCAFIMIFFSEHTIFVYRLSSFYNMFTILLVPMILTHTEKLKAHKHGYFEIRLTVILFYTIFASAYAYSLGKGAEYKIFELMYWR